MKRASLVVLVLVSASLRTGSAAAQRSESTPLDVRSVTRGLAVGLDLSSTAGGASATVAYGVNQHLAAFTRVGHERLLFADLGARYTFRSQRVALRPYVEAGTGLLSPGADIAASRLSVSAAVGAEYFATSRISLDVGIGLTRGEFTRAANERDEVPLPIGSGHSVDRVRIGVKWHPMSLGRLARR